MASLPKDHLHHNLCHGLKQSYDHLEPRRNDLALSRRSLVAGSQWLLSGRRGEEGASRESDPGFSVTKGTVRDPPALDVLSPRTTGQSSWSSGGRDGGVQRHTDEAASAEVLYRACGMI